MSANLTNLVTEIYDENTLKTTKMYNFNLYTVFKLKDLMANRFAIIVENPGAKQLCAINPNFNSAKHITSSPRVQSQLGIFNKYAWRYRPFGNRHFHQSVCNELYYDIAWVEQWREFLPNNFWSKLLAWYLRHLQRLVRWNIYLPKQDKHQLHQPKKQKWGSKLYSEDDIDAVLWLVINHQHP